MISQKQKEVLEKQQYRMVGNHSSVKVCGWTKSMIKKEGCCYKFTFYGIRSHQCMQMTTSMFCANRCTFCWRGEKAPVSKTWYGPIDPPGQIIDEALEAHKGLLQGFKGNKAVEKKMVGEFEDVRHVALSLTGEPVSYPLINEILKEFHKRKVSTFLVTNAQYPEQIQKIEQITQLYISVDAPNKELLKAIDRPLFTDYWERLLKSLDIMREAKYRTCVRLTVIQDKNDCDLEGYKSLVERAQPDFIEVKGYMYVGASQTFLLRKNMPMYDYVVDFTHKLLEYLPDYEIVSHHKASRVTLLIRKDQKKHRFIDFPKFFELCDAGKNPTTEEYSCEKLAPNR